MIVNRSFIATLKEEIISIEEDLMDESMPRAMKRVANTSLNILQDLLIIAKEEDTNEDV